MRNCVVNGLIPRWDSDVKYGKVNLNQCAGMNCAGLNQCAGMNCAGLNLCAGMNCAGLNQCAGMNCAGISVRRNEHAPV